MSQDEDNEFYISNDIIEKLLEKPENKKEESYDIHNIKYDKEEFHRNVFTDESLIGPKNQFFMKATLRRDDNGFFKPVYSAGVLPFYIKNKIIYFLLGKDNENKWSDFGGRSETNDCGRWDVTAAREFYEESIGAIMDIPSILSKIQSKNSLRIKSNTMNGSPYYMHLVKVPYKESYRNNFQCILSFIKYIKSN